MVRRSSRIPSRTSRRFKKRPFVLFFFDKKEHFKFPYKFLPREVAEETITVLSCKVMNETRDCVRFARKFHPESFRSRRKSLSKGKSFLPIEENKEILSFSLCSFLRTIFPLLSIVKRYGKSREFQPTFPSSLFFMKTIPSFVFPSSRSAE